MARHLGAHLCRCTGYVKILDAIEAVAKGKPFEPALRRRQSAGRGAKYEAAELAPRRPRLHRRHARARACCTPRCTSPPTPAPTSSRIDTAAALAAPGVVGRVHRRRHPRRAARRHHLQGLAGDDPGRRPHVVRRRRAGDRRRRDPPAGPRRGRAGRRSTTTCCEPVTDPVAALDDRRADRRVGHRLQRAAASATYARGDVDGRARRQRPHRARGVPDPAHRARLPRARDHARRARRRRRRAAPARVLRRPGRVGRPRRHRPRARRRQRRRSRSSWCRTAAPSAARRT